MIWNRYLRWISKGYIVPNTYSISYSFHLLADPSLFDPSRYCPPFDLTIGPLGKKYDKISLEVETGSTGNGEDTITTSQTDGTKTPPSSVHLRSLKLFARSIQFMPGPGTRASHPQGSASASKWSRFQPWKPWNSGLNNLYSCEACGGYGSNYQPKSISCAYIEGVCRSK